MFDYLEIGPSPCCEDCVEIGDPDYYTKSRQECLRFIKLIEKKLGKPPFGAQLVIKTFHHDFGDYREVCVKYDESNEKAAEYAFNVEANAPEKWED